MEIICAFIDEVGTPSIAGATHETMRYVTFT
jgi:hypothetical protein